MVLEPSRLVTIYSTTQIFPQYRDTPIQHLLEYHNLRHTPPDYERAEILVSMCMDARKSLQIPDRFAFVIRTAAGNLRDNEFRTAFAIGVGGVRAIAIIGHTDCGMVKLSQRRRQFVDGLVANAGWPADVAERYFDQQAPRFEIRDEAEFAVSEAERVRDLYPNVLIAPMIYRVETGMLALIKE